MKVIVDEVEGEGMVKYLGKEVVLFCANYFYTGILSGVNDVEVRLSSPSIVYETGDWSKPEWADAQKLPMKELLVRIAFIESYGECA